MSLRRLYHIPDADDATYGWLRANQWDELAKQVTDVYLVQKHPILKGCINFQKGELKRGGENMHFSASVHLKKMLMNLISSANDFGMVFDIFVLFSEFVIT